MLGGEPLEDRLLLEADEEIWPLAVLHDLMDFLQFAATGGLEAQQVRILLPSLELAIGGARALYGFYLLRDVGRHPDPVADASVRAARVA